MVAPTREEIIAALEGAGWRIDSEEPHVVEASDGERYGAAVFFERGAPTEVCYGDGEQDRQHAESWQEAPGVLSPLEVARLFPTHQQEERLG